MTDGSTTDRNILDPSTQDLRGSLLDNAFRNTIIIWIVFYITCIPAIHTPGWVLLTLIPAILLFGGYRLGMSTGKGAIEGVKFGVAVSLINILILGSTGSGENTTEVMSSSVGNLLGFAAVAAVLGAIGAELGRRRLTGPPKPVNWTSRFAITVAIMTFMLVIAGGIVTGMEQGMAVPDGLTTFNYITIFFPLERMRADAGVFVEHFHRLWGTLVGLGTIALLVQIFRTDKRGWMKIVGIVLLLAVIAQGLLGASRVIQNSLTQAMFHGVFGQCVLATMMCVAAFASNLWKSHVPVHSDKADDGDGHAVVRSGDRTTATVMFLILIVQLTLGALFRHIQVNPEAHGGALQGALKGAMHGHITGGIIVLIMAIIVGAKLSGRYRGLKPIRTSATAMMHSTVLQFLIGFGALFIVLGSDRELGDPVPGMEVAITSLHQTFGAVVLVCSALLMVWSWRLAKDSPK